LTFAAGYKVAGLQTSPASIPSQARAHPGCKAQASAYSWSAIWDQIKKTSFHHLLPLTCLQKDILSTHLFYLGYFSLPFSI